MFPSRIDPRIAADQRKDVEGEIPPSLLQRLAEAVSELGAVVANLSFYRDEQRRCRVEGNITAQVQLQCQRCMQDYPAEIAAPVDAAIVWSDDQARHLPAELDPWLAEENLDLGGAIEDELLLALPTMPVHPLAECTGVARFSTESTEAETVKATVKPFVGLEILKKSPDKNT